MPRIWQDYAACRGLSTDQWFTPEQSELARITCATCPVHDECLAYALGDPGLVGWWGGTSERERAKMRRGAA